MKIGGRRWDSLFHSILEVRSLSLDVRCGVRNASFGENFIERSSRTVRAEDLGVDVEG